MNKSFCDICGREIRGEYVKVNFLEVVYEQVCFSCSKRITRLLRHLVRRIKKEHKGGRA